MTAEAGPKILIVEDERIVARDFQGMLRGLGFGNVELASSGEEALRKADDAQPDGILMDIKLKRDMDGIEAAFRIRARHDMPVIFMSAMTDPETRSRAAALRSSRPHRALNRASMSRFPRSR